MRKEENETKYQGGNKRVNFREPEEDSYHQESLASVRDKPLEIVGKKNKKQNKMTEERARIEKLEN